MSNYQLRSPAQRQLISTASAAPSYSSAANVVSQKHQILLNTAALDTDRVATCYTAFSVSQASNLDYNHSLTRTVFVTEWNPLTKALEIPRILRTHWHKIAQDPTLRDLFEGGFLVAYKNHENQLQR